MEAPVFTLSAADPLAAATVRDWAGRMVRAGRLIDDIATALEAADAMEAWNRHRRETWPGECAEAAPPAYRLSATDPAAPHLVLDWVCRVVETGTPCFPKIREAMAAAKAMSQWRAARASAAKDV